MTLTRARHICAEVIGIDTADRAILLKARPSPSARAFGPRLRPAPSALAVVVPVELVVVHALQGRPPIRYTVLACEIGLVPSLKWRGTPSVAVTPMQPLEQFASAYEA